MVLSARSPAACSPAAALARVLGSALWLATGCSFDNSEIFGPRLDAGADGEVSPLGTQDGAGEADDQGADAMCRSESSAACASRGCDESNECDTDPQACQDQPGGGHVCACPSGYDGSGEGPDGCQNIDECSVDPPCAALRCVDLPGSVHCCADACELGPAHCAEGTLTRCEADEYSCRALVPSPCEAGFCMDPARCAVWSHSQWGTAEEDVASRVVSDGNGMLYVVGSTQGSLLQRPALGLHDAFLMKLDAQANLLWLRQFGTSEEDWASDVVIDGAGNVFVVGTTQGAMEGPARDKKNKDIFVRRFSPDGNQVWTKQLGSKDDADDLGYGVALSRAGDVYIAGETLGIFDEPKPRARDGVAIRLSSDGGLIWARQFGSDQNEYVRAIHIDPMGNPFLAGATTGNLDGLGNRGGTDAFSCWMAGGAGDWRVCLQWGTPEDDGFEALVLDSSNEIILVGTTRGAMPGQTSAGDQDVLVVRQTVALTTAWIRQFGSSAADQGVGVALDRDGGLLIGGATSGMLGGRAAGAGDAFAAKLDPSGATRWISQWGTPGDDSIKDVAPGVGGAVFAAGSCRGPLATPPAYPGGADVCVTRIHASE